VFVVEATREWAPIGADRFYNLVKNGFFDNNRFFRVITGFMVQFGINGDPAIQRYWTNANLQDEPVKVGNTRGFISYAKGGPNTRSTQIFINYRDNSGLNRQGFAPFGKVISGMEVVDKLFAGYAEAAQAQSERIESEGNAFLAKNFPKLDYIKKATIEQ
jgi:peptidyl-prolyl cis-trans isomerase A (cyclophilin A)